MKTAAQEIERINALTNPQEIMRALAELQQIFKTLSGQEKIDFLQTTCKSKWSNRPTTLCSHFIAIQSESIIEQYFKLVTNALDAEDISAETKLSLLEQQVSDCMETRASPTHLNMRFSAIKYGLIPTLTILLEAKNIPREEKLKFLQKQITHYGEILFTTREELTLVSLKIALPYLKTPADLKIIFPIAPLPTLKETIKGVTQLNPFMEARLIELGLLDLTEETPAKLYAETLESNPNSAANYYLACLILAGKAKGEDLLDSSDVVNTLTPIEHTGPFKIKLTPEKYALFLLNRVSTNSAVYEEATKKIGFLSTSWTATLFDTASTVAPSSIVSFARRYITPSNS